MALVVQFLGRIFIQRIRVNTCGREIDDERRDHEFDFNNPEFIVMVNQSRHPEPSDFVDMLFFEPAVYGQFLPIKWFVLE